MFVSNNNYLCPRRFAGAHIVPVRLFCVLVNVRHPLVGPRRGVRAHAVGDGQRDVFAGVGGQGRLGSRPRSLALENNVTNEESRILECLFCKKTTTKQFV